MQRVRGPAAAGSAPRPETAPDRAAGRAKRQRADRPARPATAAPECRVSKLRTGAAPCVSGFAAAPKPKVTRHQSAIEPSWFPMRRRFVDHRLQRGNCWPPAPRRNPVTKALISVRKENPSGRAAMAVIPASRLPPRKPNALRQRQREREKGGEMVYRSSARLSGFSSRGWYSSCLASSPLRGLATKTHPRQIFQLYYALPLTKQVRLTSSKAHHNRMRTVIDYYEPHGGSILRVSDGARLNPSAHLNFAIERWRAFFRKNLRRVE